MTPQSAFMLIAAIEPAREPELRRLLESMNSAPGRVDPGNRLVPFESFASLHVARLLILDDPTAEDIRAHGREPRPDPRYFAMLGDVDGEARDFFRELAGKAPEGLRALFSCCRDFTPDTPLAKWMLEHQSPATANYVNCRGRTVKRVREEARLCEALAAHLASNAELARTRTPRELHAALRDFAHEEQRAGRLTLSPDEPTPWGWRLRDTAHLIGVPLLLLALLPLLAVAAPFYAIWLRRREARDPELCDSVDQGYTEALSRFEDHDVTNAFTAIGSLKPGLLRLLTIFGVLSAVDYAARHFIRPGRLGRIRSIHFARWVFIGGKHRMAFFSNYDGSVESYMDDFINKTGFGLNAVFSNGVGYPRTRWLVLDGCGDERKYKEFLRRHTIPSQVWYKAYPGLTAVDLERNTRIRGGIENPMTRDRDAAEWTSLL